MLISCPLPQQMHLQCALGTQPPGKGSTNWLAEVLRQLGGLGSLASKAMG